MDNSTKLFVLDLVKVNRAQAMKDRIRWSEKNLLIRRPQRIVGSKLVDVFDERGFSWVVKNGYWKYEDDCFSYTRGKFIKLIWEFGDDKDRSFTVCGASFWSFRMVNLGPGLVSSDETVKRYSEDFNPIDKDRKNNPELGKLIGEPHPRHNWYSEIEDRVTQFRWDLRDYEPERYKRLYG